MIHLTDAAAKHIEQSLTKRGKGIGIRLGVKTTGCSGLAYVLEYADTPEPEDKVFTQDSFKVIVDPKSLAYVDGIEMDYLKQGINEGFEFKNPKEAARCGCGESFTVDAGKV